MRALALFTWIPLVFGQFYSKTDLVDWTNRVLMAQNPDALRHVQHTIEEWIVTHPMMADSFATGSLLLKADYSSSKPEQVHYLAKYTRQFCVETKRWPQFGVRPECAQGFADWLCSIAVLAELMTSTPSNASAQANVNVMDHLWMFQMFDAFGKFRSGLAQGDLQWLGSYDECINVQAQIPRGPEQHSEFQGKYCKAYLNLKKPTSHKMYKHLCGTGTEGNCTSITSQVGMCVPSTCNSQDIMTLVHAYLSQSPSPFCYTYIVCEETPQVTRDVFMIVVCSFSTLLLLVILAATTYDFFIYQTRMRALPKTFAIKFQSEYMKPKNGDHFIHARPDGTVVNEIVPQTVGEYQKKLGTFYKILLSLSVYTNGKRLLSTAHRDNQVECVHGLRVISMLWVILANVYCTAPKFVNNPLHLTTAPRQFLFQIVNQASLAADSFLVISGYLIAHRFFQSVGSKQLKSRLLKMPRFWVQYYLKRYLRVTPVYIAVIVLVLAAWNYFGDGPLWTSMSETPFIARCAVNWWQNVLYINNMWSYNEQCFPWTWYVAVEMQMYWLAPLLLVTIVMYPYIGIGLSVLLVVLSMLARGWVTLVNGYPPSLVITTKVANFASLAGDFATEMYEKPWMRCGPFIVGVLLAFTIMKTKRKVHIGPCLSYLIWIVIGLITSMVMFGLWNYATDAQPLNPWVTAMYAAVNRNIWALVVAATMFMCLHGYGGHIADFLSWNTFYPLSRLSLSAYLTHELLIYAYFSKLRDTDVFSHYMVLSVRSDFCRFRCPTIKRNNGNMTLLFQFYVFLSTLFTTYVCSLALNLVFEAPIRQLESLWIRNLSKKQNNKQNHITLSDGQQRAAEPLLTDGDRIVNEQL